MATMHAEPSPNEYAHDHVTLGLIRSDMGFRSDAPGLGDYLPDFDLPSLDGGRIRSQGLLGKLPIVLVPASVTCPMTASSDPILSDLHHQFYNRVQFLTLYVREAHPGERFPQPRTIEEKMRHARLLKERDGISWPIVIDDVAGTLHRALDTKPNSAYLVDRDGQIVYRALWAGDGSGLRQAIERFVAGDRPFYAESQRRLGPMIRGMGRMRKVLHEAGLQAERDMWRAAMPIAATAWTANLFRPLHPNWRVPAALSFLALGTVVAIKVASRARRAD